MYIDKFGKIVIKIGSSILIDKKQRPNQSILRISQPQKSKKTKMIDGSVDQQVLRLVDILKKELKLL